MGKALLTTLGWAVVVGGGVSAGIWLGATSADVPADGPLLLIVALVAGGIAFVGRGLYVLFLKPVAPPPARAAAPVAPPPEPEPPEPPEPAPAPPRRREPLQARREPAKKPAAKKTPAKKAAPAKKPTPRKKEPS